MQGILNINKPAGWTSHDVVAKLRGILKERRIGHGGTLDPMAVGVLPVFVGRATRAVDYLPGEKEYRAQFRLGARTDTGDSTGQVIRTSLCRPALTEILTAAQAFKGDILQTPPMVSAVKVNGQRLYKLARQGKDVVREARSVCISRLDIGELEEEDAFWMEVTCSKGTYIRTLVDDLGVALGSFAHMTALTRLRAGPFCLEQAITLEDVSRLVGEGALAQILTPLDVLWPQAAPFTASEIQRKALRNGALFEMDLPEGLYRIYDAMGVFLCLGRVAERENRREMRCEKSFFEIEHP